MGLDMYLSKKTYVRNWDHMGPDEKHQITVKKGGKIVKEIKPERISYVIEQVAYWRKANSIHKWFVDNCQGGADDCRDAYVEKEQLMELVTLCKEVLASVETVPGDINTGTTYHGDGRIEHHTEPGQVVAQTGVAAAMLPTQAGCFFGGTDYDQYYLDDLRDTIKQVEPLLTEKDGDYYYHSSW